MNEAIGRRARDREIRRQLRHNETRKAAIRSRAAIRGYVAERIPEPTRSYLETLLGALLGIFVIAWLLGRFAGLSPLYTYSALGLVYALQATYYKRRLARDPEFRIPSCKCAGRREDGSEGVLASRQSVVLGIPASVVAAAFFCAILALHAAGQSGAALPAAAVAVGASAYFGYVMVVKLHANCTICINIAALTVLILWQLAL